MRPDSFLGDLAQNLLQRHGEHLGRLTIIFPDGQSSHIFKSQLATRIHRPVFLPRFLTLRTWVQQLSQLQLKSSLTLLSELYATVQSIRPTQETFEQFYSWGQQLLQDFDAIDKYEVDANRLFRTLHDYKVLASDVEEQLTEAQWVAIQAFWQGFERRSSDQQQRFLSFWKMLPKVYTSFRARLLQRGWSYEGLCYQQACQALQNDQASEKGACFVIAGFHVLSKSLESLLATLQQKVPTEFYWDVDAYYMTDERQEAGAYLRRYQQKAIFRKSFHPPFPQRIATSPKHIQLIGAPSEAGQVQVIGQELEGLIKTHEGALDLSQVAIVVTNEAFAMPMLHALPKAVSHVNTRLGMPLQETLAYQLFYQLMEWQMSLEDGGLPPEKWPVHRLMDLLSHPHFSLCIPSMDTHLQMLRAFTAMYIQQSALGAPYDTFLKCVKASTGLAYLQQCIAYILAAPSHASLSNWELQAYQQLKRQLDKLEVIYDQQGQPNSWEAWSHFFKRLMGRQQVHWIGKPNQDGLHLLHILDTTNKDFEHVFLVGMNEGYCPPQTTPSTFIAHSLRKGYGLPIAHQHQATLYAYHFYRLLQRARQVCITYSTQVNSRCSGEMSRYLQQLLVESGLPIVHRQVANSPSTAPVKPILIPKSVAIKQLLESFTRQPEGYRRRISPSAINTYLDCRLRFYFRYVLGLKEATSPPDGVDMVQFGILLHQTMEQLYQPYVGRQVTPEDLTMIQRRVKQVIKSCIQQLAYNGEAALASGPSAIAEQVLQKLVMRILAVDRDHAPFQILSLEASCQGELEMQTTAGHSLWIGLQGIIDRVDEKDDVVRVLDYKSGYDELRFPNLPALFDRSLPKRNRAALQVLLYAWLLPHTSANQPIMPGILSSRHVFSQSFDPRLMVKQGRHFVPFNHNVEERKLFLQHLRATLQELFDPEVPFDQTPHVSSCKQCPYRSICQRN